MVLYFMSLTIRQTCISNLHVRMQYLTAQLNEIAELIDCFEQHPKRVNAIRERLSICSKCCMLMKDTLLFLSGEGDQPLHLNPTLNPLLY